MFGCFNFDVGIENAHSSLLMLTGGGYGIAREEMLSHLLWIVQCAR